MGMDMLAMKQEGAVAAIKAVKRARRLAEALGLSAVAIHDWKRRGIPAERVLSVEAVTGVSRHVLRPDLYPRDGR
jgi:DNA-binding transcriptional regulator YdaS (Cro superfamily)